MRTHPRPLALSSLVGLQLLGTCHDSLRNGFVSVRQKPDSCWPSWQGWRYSAPYGCHDARDEMPPTIDALLRDLRDHADEEFGFIYRWAAARER
jgi:hypothetical protein